MKPACPMCSGLDCDRNKCVTLPGWEVTGDGDPLEDGPPLLELDSKMRGFLVLNNEWDVVGYVNQQATGAWSADVAVYEEGDRVWRVKLGDFTSCQEAAARADKVATEIVNTLGSKVEEFVGTTIEAIAAMGAPPA